MNKSEFDKIRNEILLYDVVYDVLVDIGGADERDRVTFIVTHLSGNDYPCQEWRFQGYFGFGGKYYRQTNRVSYYKEDETEELDVLCKKINDKLTLLK